VKMESSMEAFVKMESSMNEDERRSMKEGGLKCVVWCR